MSQRLSQLNPLSNPTGSENLYAATPTANYKITIAQLLGLVQLPTKTSLGMEFVQNTTDLDKPISNLTAQALQSKANATHNHAIADVTGLTAALDQLAVNIVNLGDNTQLDIQQVIDSVSQQVTAINTALSNKAASTHNHSIGEVTGLADALLTKADATAVNQQLQVFDQAIQGKAATNHTHNASEINGLIVPTVGFVQQGW